MSEDYDKWASRFNELLQEMASLSGEDQEKARRLVSSISPKQGTVYSVDDILSEAERDDLLASFQEEENESPEDNSPESGRNQDLETPWLG